MPLDLRNLQVCSTFGCLRNPGHFSPTKFAILCISWIEIRRSRCVSFFFGGVEKSCVFFDFLGSCVVQECWILIDRREIIKQSAILIDQHYNCYCYRVQNSGGSQCHIVTLWFAKCYWFMNKINPTFLCTASSGKWFKQNCIFHVLPVHCSVFISVSAVRACLLVQNVIVKDILLHFVITCHFKYCGKISSDPVMAWKIWMMVLWEHNIKKEKRYALLVTLPSCWCHGF